MKRIVITTALTALAAVLAITAAPVFAAGIFVSIAAGRRSAPWQSSWLSRPAARS